MPVNMPSRLPKVRLASLRDASKSYLCPSRNFRWVKDEFLAMPAVLSALIDHLEAFENEVELVEVEADSDDKEGVNEHDRDYG